MKCRKCRNIAFVGSVDSIDFKSHLWRCSVCAWWNVFYPGEIVDIVTVGRSEMKMPEDLFGTRKALQTIRKLQDISPTAPVNDGLGLTWDGCHAFGKLAEVVEWLLDREMERPSVPPCPWPLPPKRVFVAEGKQLPAGQWKVVKLWHYGVEVEEIL